MFCSNVYYIFMVFLVIRYSRNIGLFLIPIFVFDILGLPFQKNKNWFTGILISKRYTSIYTIFIIAVANHSGFE